MALPWILSTGFVLMYGTLFARTWRIFKVFVNKKVCYVSFSEDRVARVAILEELLHLSHYTHSSPPFISPSPSSRVQLRMVKVDNLQLLAIVGGMLAIQWLLLVLWTAIDRREAHVVVVDEHRPFYNYPECDISTVDIVFLSLIGAYWLVIMLAGMLVVFRVRNVSYVLYNESRLIGTQPVVRRSWCALVLFIIFFCMVWSVVSSYSLLFSSVKASRCTTCSCLVSW
jgi:7 transmembrane sweet-taste receptor of 3 GCPR